MIDAGQMALLIALIVAVYSAIVSLLGGYKRIPKLSNSGRYGLYTLPILLIISSVSLIYAFVTHDFSIKYVFENSNLAMPSAYTWVAFYAGNAGSLLFIALILSILASIAVFTVQRRLLYASAYAAGILSLILTFFLGIMVFLANPLERLMTSPIDGQGINPLLVHFGMFIHPPMQMSGLVCVAIPFSIALGVVLARRGGQDVWVDVGRTWAMISWTILTAGLLLGSWWAYTILGWGGYWAWDPVENSALMPWLAMTAFVHSIMVQKRRGMFRMWNVILIIVAFTLAQLGMFINRGGPVPSVHSFAESTMGWLFLMFMGVTLLASLVAFLMRIPTLKSSGNIDSILSREGIFLAQNVLFLTVAFITLWGTVFPIFSEAASDTTVTVGQPFFNQVNGPLLLLLVLLMGIGPLLPWRKTSLQSLIRSLKYPVAVGVITAIVLIGFGMRQPLAILAFSICGLTSTGVIHEWIRGTLSRHRNGEMYPAAFINLLKANRPRYGGYIVHLGIILLAIGAIASSYFSIQRDILMEPGDTASLNSYTFNYLDVDFTSYSDRDEAVAELEVYYNDSYIGILRPFRAIYTDFRIAATRGAIRSTPVEDFYIVPSEFDETGKAIFRVMINPLVWWMWVSGPLMLLGVLLAISPQGRESPSAASVLATTRTSRRPDNTHGNTP